MCSHPTLSTLLSIFSCIPPFLPTSFLSFHLPISLSLSLSISPLPSLSSSQVQYFSQPVSQWGPYYHGDPNYMPYMNGYHPPQGFGMLSTLRHGHTFYVNVKFRGATSVVCGGI